MSVATKIKAVPSNLEWGFDCEVPLEHKAMTVQIGFSHSEQESDETEFCVSATDSEMELDALFNDFCKENGYTKCFLGLIIVTMHHGTMSNVSR